MFATEHHLVINLSLGSMIREAAAVTPRLLSRVMPPQSSPLLDHSNYWPYNADPESLIKFPPRDGKLTNNHVLFLG